MVLRLRCVIAFACLVLPATRLARAAPCPSGEPGIEYSTFLGGVGDDRGYAIAADGRGGVYVAGETYSVNFPRTMADGGTRTSDPGSPDFLRQPRSDAFVAKFDFAAGEPMLVWATRLGGSGDDRATGVAVDEAGSAYLTGITYSSDFPITQNALAGTLKGAADAFVTKLSADGRTLVYSTFLGGSDLDYGLSLAVSSADEVYLTGGTQSPDFPTTPGAFQPASGGDVDMFIAKLDSSGSKLSFATYLGGYGFEDGWGICVDRLGDAVITGRTSSPDYPVTPGVFQNTWQGSLDTVVSKLSADGSALIYSTFVSADRRDEGHAIALDDSGAAYVTGVARSEIFPTTPGAYDTTGNGGYDVIVFKLDPLGSRLEYSTFLGGTEHDVGWDIAVDALGQAYVTGVCYSADFPTTFGSYSPHFNGHCDAFVAELNATGSQLLYSTFLGRIKMEEGVALALYDPASGAALGSDADRANGPVDAHAGADVFLTGYTFSPFFPTTADAYDSSWNGDFDAFLTKLDLRSSCQADSLNYGVGWPGTGGVTPSLTSSGPPVMCSPFSVIIADAYAPSNGAVIVGLDEADLPTSLGGRLLVSPSWILSIPITSSPLELPIDLCEETFCGLRVFMQAMILDPGASQSVSFTPGLRLDLGSAR
jgi:hypothetical protein